MTGRLAVNIAGLKLANPTMLAAGILGMSSSTLKRVAEQGAGAVVTKSLSLKPNSGYLNPTLAQVEGGFINAMGLPNPGIDHFAREIQAIKGANVPVVVSIYAKSPHEFAVTAKKALEAGADALELNVSCPHVAKAGAEIGQDPKLVQEVVEATKKTVEKPVFVKLTPNVAKISELAEAAEKGGADAVTAINTVKAMVINIETAKPILSHGVGGLSGSAIKPIAVRCVYEVYKAVNIPVIGCGGIDAWQDAVEFLQAGASAIQIGTAVATKGLKVFKQVSKGVENYLENKKFANVNEIVGLAHRR